MSQPGSHKIDNNLKSRRQNTLDRVYIEFHEEVARKCLTAEIVYDKCLKKLPLPENAQDIAALNAKYPLYGSQQSNGISFWEVNSNPVRQFRRTYETAKPFAEYFRDAQWR